MTVTRKPILANDPHRPIQLPSLRKSVHLVAPGWNAFGAGEPALPGIAIGHNERVAFGFTIIGIDQGNLYVEKIIPADPGEYSYKGGWRKFRVVHEQIAVKGQSKPEEVDLLYTIHGPVIHEDRARNRVYALRWVGSEPGAGYLPGLGLMQARNRDEFRKSLESYRVPSENIVYADVDGNIGWQASGLTPVRENWSGLFPVPGDSGEFEWKGFLEANDLPSSWNPKEHFIATANHNILPSGYPFPIAYEWAAPFRFLRIREMLTSGRKFSVSDFERMQQDVTCQPARRFQAIASKLDAPEWARDLVKQVLSRDSVLAVNSAAAAIYEVWTRALPVALFGPELGSRVDLEMTLRTLENEPNPKAVLNALGVAVPELEKLLGKDRREWAWVRLHRIRFDHPVPGLRELVSSHGRVTPIP